jgi:hypothetical protein
VAATWLTKGKGRPRRLGFGRLSGTTQGSVPVDDGDRHRPGPAARPASPKPVRNRTRTAHFRPRRQRGRKGARHAFVGIAGAGLAAARGKRASPPRNPRNPDWRRDRDAGRSRCLQTAVLAGTTPPPHGKLPMPTFPCDPPAAESGRFVR